MLRRLMGGGGPAAEVVDRFYAAIARAEHVAAFGCLGVSRRSPVTEPLDLDELTRREAAITEAQGPLEAHAITNWSTARGIRLLRQPATASYTVRVTRGGATGTVHPRVERGDDGVWRIVAFDRTQLNMLH